MSAIDDVVVHQSARLEGVGLGITERAFGLRVRHHSRDDGHMRRVLVLCVLGLSCTNDAKDAEIARLRAQLAQQPSVPSAPTKTEPTGPPLAGPVVDTTPPADATTRTFDARSNAEGEALETLLREAEGTRDITYAHLKKNAERYREKVWSFSGNVLEIQEVEGGTIARIGFGYYRNDVMWVVARFQTDFVQGNVVDVVGVLRGNYSYQSQAGWNITVPSMQALSIQKYGTFARVRRAKKIGKRSRTDDDD